VTLFLQTFSPSEEFLQFNKQVLIKMCLRTGAPEVQKVCSVKN
jgi:hypothetical protein